MSPPRSSSRISLAALVAALAACGDPEETAPDGTPAPDAIDAPIDAPPVACVATGPDVTVHARHGDEPIADARVLVHCADGQLLAEGTTDASGAVTLPGGALVTADPMRGAQRNLRSVPIAGRTDVTLAFGLPTTPVRVPVSFVNAPAGTVRFDVVDACGVSVEGDELVRYPCGVAADQLLAEAIDASARTLAIAVAPSAASITFDTWEPAVDQTATITGTPQSTFPSHGVLLSTRILDFTSRVVPGRLAMIETAEPGPGGDFSQWRARRMLRAAPPPTIEVPATELLPFLTDATITRTEGAVTLHVVPPAGGYDACRIVAIDLTSGGGRWFVFTGPMTAPTDVLLPALPTDLTFTPSQHQLDCFRNLSRIPDPNEIPLPPAEGDLDYNRRVFLASP